VVLSVPTLMVLPAVPVPMLIVLALLPVPRFTAPVVPESRLRALEVVVLIVPAAAKVTSVAENNIVSMEATPVRAPPVVTLSPPLEVRAKVPVALPIVTLLVPVPREMAPLPFAVNVPEDWVYPVMPERAPALIIKLLMVLEAVGAVIAPPKVAAPAEVTVKLVPVM